MKVDKELIERIRWLPSLGHDEGDEIAEALYSMLDEIEKVQMEAFMASDIVEKLRLLSECCCDAWHVHRQETMDHEVIADEAIYEIERLRAMLENNA